MSQKPLIKVYINYYKDTTVFAYYYFASNKIYYNLAFTGSTKIYVLSP